MDFFERQDAARRKTGRLVVLFALAVVSIILSVYLVVAVVLLYASDGQAPVWHPGLFLAVVAATAAVVASGSLYKITQLRGGGRVVAESLGGRLIPHDAKDPGERRILNVVEEMAIASGTPVPPVYLLAQEKGINAFAAGYTPNDAVIGVTAGTLEQLNRSELQGVVGHEFSHILNGDMRLNIRLIGILNGILVIGLIGYFILRSVGSGSRMGRSRGRGKDGGGIAAVLAIGAGLAAVGFMGTFFGNLIKAGVSRQREYLADASAVQFTRDPTAVAGALKRIGGFVHGSGLVSPNAPEASHMFFAKGLTSGFTSWFATHPPLEDRIRRIEPGWDGTYPAPRALPSQERPPRAAPTATPTDVARIVTGAAILAGGGGSAAVAQVGVPTEAHVQHAASLLASLPAAVLEAVHEPYGARALVYVMLLDREPDVRAAQLRHLSGKADPGVRMLVDRLADPVAALAPEARLPLIDLATSTLRELTPPQYSVFRANIIALEQADQTVSLFEWVLRRMILRHLEPQFGRVETAPVRYYSLSRLDQPCAVLLSALAYVGHADAALAERAFQAGSARLGFSGLRLLAREDCDLGVLDEALAVLNTVSFKLKRDLLEAGAAVVGADRRVSAAEGELLRGIADALGCPMPPLLSSSGGTASDSV